MRHNLPVALSSFVGREQAVADVAARLEAARLLTLAGVGGCGKTRLALETARAVLERYPDGVWLVELAPVADGSLIAQRVGSVLGVRETASGSMVAALIGILANRRLLLVIDNCEHLLDSCAVLVDELLRGCPNVQVLATSREPISIDGEIIWRVPSLPVPDTNTALTLSDLRNNPSVQLLVERATAVKPGFALTERNAPSVAHICQRLDGIPLALELAAARIEALSPEQLALRLDQRFSLLTGGSRAALPRQQTLGAALDWSYNLLSRPERRVFEQLAVFAGGSTLEAAEAVCSGSGVLPEDVFDLLAKLVRKSLVIASDGANGATRYRLLETVRDYAREKLVTHARSEAAAVRERHADYYTNWAERLNPPGRVWHLAATTADADLEHLEVEHDNLQTALAWSVESGRVSDGLRLMRAIRGHFIWRGAYSEASRWMEALLDLAERTPMAIPRDQRGTALGAAGMLAIYQGDYHRAVGRLEQAAAVFRELNEPAHLAFALSRLGLGLWLAGDTDRATGVLDESVRLGRTIGDGNTVAMSLRNMGVIACSQGMHRRAAELFRDSVAQARAIGWDRGYNIARPTSQLGRVAYLQGDFERARQHLCEALVMCSQSRLGGHTLSGSLDWLAAVENAQGDPVRATRLLGAGDAQWRASGAVRYGPEQSEYERDLASVRAQLDKTAFSEAWAEGQAMNAEQAIAYALGYDASAHGGRPSFSTPSSSRGRDCIGRRRVTARWPGQRAHPPPGRGPVGRHEPLRP